MQISNMYFLSYTTWHSIFTSYTISKVMHGILIELILIHNIQNICQTYRNSFPQVWRQVLVDGNIQVNTADTQLILLFFLEECKIKIDRMWSQSCWFLFANFFSHHPVWYQHVFLATEFGGAFDTQRVCLCGHGIVWLHLIIHAKLGDKKLINLFIIKIFVIVYTVLKTKVKVTRGTRSV